jgi:hypothetical protein
MIKVFKKFHSCPNILGILGKKSPMLKKLGELKNFSHCLGKHQNQGKICTNNGNSQLPNSF